jgi:hypothetical protein
VEVVKGVWEVGIVGFLLKGKYNIILSKIQRGKKGDTLVFQFQTVIIGLKRDL